VYFILERALLLEIHFNIILEGNVFHSQQRGGKIASFCLSRYFKWPTRHINRKKTILITCTWIQVPHKHKIERSIGGAYISF
jgi:hypothetical protein